MSSTTALVPFKLNSERVPNKNFRLLGGKPLYWWVLESLINSKCVDRIIINTDARTLIERFGLPTGIEIVIKNRKSELCGDLVSMNSIIKDDINEFDANSYLMTHTTNPFVLSSTFSRAVKQYLNGTVSGEIDSLFSANKLQSRLYSHSLEPLNHSPYELLRTQDLDPIYEENSCFYIFSKSSFLSSDARIGTKPAIAIIQRLESIDIDTEEDWFHAEVVAAGLSSR